MTTLPVAELLDAAAERLERFERDLRDLFIVKGENFVEPPDTHDVWLNAAVRGNRSSVYGRLWDVVVQFHHALRLLGFVDRGQPLNETVIGTWSTAWDSQWEAPADTRPLCARLLLRGQRVMHEHARLGTPKSGENGVPYHEIPISTAVWATELASTLRAEANSLRPAPPSQPEIDMIRPVPIAEVAKVLNRRSDTLLEMLRAREYPIGGMKGCYVAELRHVLATFPRSKRRLLQWADKEFPAS